MKKLSRKARKNRLDKLCRAVVFHRDGHACQKCGAVEGEAKLDWAHVVTRRILVTRWDLDDSLVFCAGCHMWMDQHPLQFAEFMKKRLGEKAYWRLIRTSNAPRPFKIADYEYWEDKLSQIGTKGG